MAPISSPVTFTCIPTGGTIAAGETVIITMVGRVPENGQTDNTASVDSTITSDQNQSDNTSVASVIGIPEPVDLTVTKTVLERLGSLVAGVP